MTIAECYRALGGDYAQVEKRLCSLGLIRRFISMFLEDDSFGLLLCAMGDGRREDAHRAAYTLRSVCANLGFDRLCASTVRLEHALEGESSVMPEGAQALLDAVVHDYTATVAAIRDYLCTSGPEATYPPDFLTPPDSTHEGQNNGV